MKKIIFATFLLAITIQLQAQLAMGKWRTHLAYNATNLITQSDRQIYAVGNGALFSVNKEDESITSYSKITGLNDVNISWIDYDNNGKKLLISYANGNIDLLTETGIKNIPDLFNKPMNSNKKVNHSFFYNDTAYLSCNFGIIALNTKRNEIADTYYIGPNGSELNILNTIVYNNSIYAQTNSQIYFASVDNRNLANYQQWKAVQNLPGSGTLNKIILFNNRLALHRDNKLYILNSDESWSQLLPSINIQKVFTSNNRLLIYSSPNELYSVSTDLKVSPFTNLGEVINATFEPNKQVWWLAGNAKGVIAVHENQSNIKTYLPEGPKNNIAWNMTFSDNKLFVVPGGRWAAQYQRTGQVMVFENEKWTNYDTDTIAKATGINALDFMTVAVNPKDNNHFFITSYGRGVYEFKNNKFHKWHNITNSTLETIIPSSPYDYTRTDGAAFDKDGNLLIVNTYTNSLIKVYTNSEWKSLTFPTGKRNVINQLLISNTNPNQKWINAPREGAGIFVYDDNGTLLEQSDDKSTFLSSFIDTDGNSISPTYVYCLNQDKNGVIWAGTNQGPLLFYNTSRVFEPGFTCSRIKIPRNDGTNLADYLLESEQIKAIAIDGANRKWIGTESSGVFLMSENGQETIKHFTTTNSPLISNEIMSLGINPKTGEVFIGTSQGLVSYQSNASNAENSFNNVHAYPNPVREDYKGLITITGLIEKTNVKITDINGNLVFQTKSNGSIATWNGKAGNGKKVKTGVYLAICANEDGTQNAIAKIMIIN